MKFLGPNISLNRNLCELNEMNLFYQINISSIIRGLCCDAGSIWSVGNVVAKCRVRDNRLAGTWKKAVIVVGFFPEGLREDTKDLNKDSGCPDRNWKIEPPEYK